MSKRSQAEVNSAVSAKMSRVVAEGAAIGTDASAVEKQTSNMDGTSSNFTLRRDEDAVIRPNDIWVDDDGADSDIDIIAVFAGDNSSNGTRSSEQIENPEECMETSEQASSAAKSEIQGEPESDGGSDSEDGSGDENAENTREAMDDVAENQQQSIYISKQEFRCDSDESTCFEHERTPSPFSCSSDEDSDEYFEDVEEGPKQNVPKLPRCQGSKIVAHLMNFEKMELTPEMCETLPFQLREYAELGKFKFQAMTKKGKSYSPITLYLMSAFIHKSALLQHDQSNLGQYGCLKVTVTEKMLALLICVLTKYRHEEFDYSHILECEKYFDGLNHPCKNIWECAKEEMQWIQEPGWSPFQKISETRRRSHSQYLFDELFSRYRDLELDTKLFLICLTESEEKKSLEGCNK